MIPNQSNKYVAMFPIGALASSATGQTNTANYVDTLGYDNLDVVVQVGTVAATDTIVATFTIQHSDTTAATDFADITGYVGGTSFTIPTVGYTAVTAITNVHAAASIPLQGKKRYIRPKFTPSTNSTNQVVNILGILSRAEQSPTNASGVNAQVFITPPSS